MRERVPGGGGCRPLFYDQKSRGDILVVSCCSLSEATMKALLAVLILTSSAAFAQEKPTGTAIAPGCGPSSAKFEAETDAHRHPVRRPESGKAIVFFIEDDTKFL